MVLTRATNVRTVCIILFRCTPGPGTLTTAAAQGISWRRQPSRRYCNIFLQPNGLARGPEVLTMTLCIRGLLQKAPTWAGGIWPVSQLICGRIQANVRPLERSTFIELPIWTLSGTCGENRVKYKKCQMSNKMSKPTRCEQTKYGWFSLTMWRKSCQKQEINTE